MKQIKKMIGPGILFALIVGVILFIVFYEKKEVEEKMVKIHAFEGTEKEFVLENEKLKFELDAATTQFSVTVKETGKQWFSNPVDAASDTLALSAEKGKLQSTLWVTYSNVGGIDALYNNYDYSIVKGIYDIEAGEDYIKVLYSVGNTEKKYMIPPVIRADDLNAYIAKMERDEGLLVQDYYKKYDINKLGKKDNKEELLANYPILAEEVIYVLRPTTKDNLKSKFEVYFANAGYTEEDYKADLELDKSVVTTDVPIFNVNVIYRLEDGDLKVEIPLQEIEYKEDYPLYSLTVLPYFGAGGPSEEGFMLVPEGGGALINFNNGKTTQNGYYANVYGWDMAQNRVAVIHETETAFGVYGIAKEDAAFLCILEEGAPYAAIQADIGGKKTSYNYANAVYSIVHREQYDIMDESQGSTFVYEKKLPDETLVQRYRFVDSGSYVDMAETYQEYFLNKYETLVKKNHTEAPVALEIVNAVDKVKQVLGVPVPSPLTLTTFGETQEMLEDLKAAGLDNVSVKLTGWANGGVKQEILKDVSLVRGLGGKKELQSLVDYAEANGMSLYLNGITNYAMNSGLLEGFFSFTDAARLVSKERAELYNYRTVTYIQDLSEDPYYLLKPSIIEKMVDNLTQEAGKYDVGVSFEDIGDRLSSDYNRQTPVSRQAALLQHQAWLKEISEAGTGVMINTGNEYALPYAAMVTNMDLAGQDYSVIDKKVPFYQLALHGFVDYTGEPINLTQNKETELLKSAEYGAGLSFALMNESTFTLQKTKYSQYFGADYESCRDKVVETYNRYNQELGHVFGQEMVNHEYVADNVTCTTYEDGTRVYVNYDYEDYKLADGTVIVARDYMVIR